MKKTNDYFSLIEKIQKHNMKKNKGNNNNLSIKLSKSNINHNKKQNQIHLHFDKKNSYILKQNKSKTKTISNSRYNTEYTKSTSKIKLNSNQILIDSYEKSVISLFGTLKNIVEKSQYENLKNKFKHSFESNLKQIEKKSSSFINSSNSIKKIIDESIKKCQSNNKKSTSNNKNNKNSNVKLNINPLININKTHKSLYSLSRSGRRIITQSPNKFSQNINHSIIKKYYTVVNINKNSKSTQNGSSYLSGNKNSNSRQNISKELSFPKCNNNTIPKNNNNNLENKINEKKIEEINNINKTTDDSQANNELLNKIKNSLDDSLKGIFAFSYEDFLNRSSDRLEKK